MNILIIPSFLFSKNDPTLGSFVWEQALALKSEGHNVYVLFSDTFSIKYIKQYLLYRENKEEIINGIHVFREKKLCPLKHLNGFKGCREEFSDGILRLYKKYLSNTQIDIIHAHCCAWAGYAAMKLSKEINIPYVITEHSSLYGLDSKIISFKEMQLLSQSFNNAKSVICVSDALAKLIKVYCNSDIHILGNVIDCDEFCIEQVQKTDRPEIIFLTVCYMKNEGQLKNKGIDLLLDAFSEIVKDYSNVHLIIGGGGNGVDILKKWIQERKIEQYITLLGPLSRKEVADEMKKCDVFVLPSRYETFGVVYAEAMACGKPVIATKTGGPDSFVNPFNGLMIDVENKKQLVEAIGYMVNNVRKYDSNLIRDTIVKSFSMKAIADSLLEIYGEALL